MPDKETALIVGAGKGLSASLARLFASEGMDVAIAARNIDKLSELCEETGAIAYPCDAADAKQVETLFANVRTDISEPDLVIYNASNRARGPVQDLDAEAVRTAIEISCFGGFLVAQAAAKQMIPRNSGTILLTGASASVKGYPNSSSFAMGKFGLRGLAQSLARELQPQNIHVAHFVIDGGILQGPDDARASERGKDAMLLPDEIAKDYLHVHRQHRSSWTWEIELRPWVEKF
ncbi:MAG: Sepiapterin reductase [Alphaproteobacteria bacterium MarineAlpha11_Bin1]|nr:MAG: Sepiapterin reductase [Alphaproteobacteria bacterium MarineAlpha11_Bin1]|tara:strand:+ start:4684 stop:5385 length:702 start_codon:yes stop_codon:yes gene_type:complete